jgi:hypothetical protein
VACTRVLIVHRIERKGLRTCFPPRLDMGTCGCFELDESGVGARACGHWWQEGRNEYDNKISES